MNLFRLSTPWHITGVLLLMVMAAPASAHPVIDNDLQTEKVVMLMRQGIASQNPMFGGAQPIGRTTLNLGGADAPLTRHGRDALILWGQYHRRLMADRQLLPAEGPLTQQQVSTFAHSWQRGHQTVSAFLHGFALDGNLAGYDHESPPIFMPMTGIAADAHHIERRDAVLDGLGMALHEAQYRYRPEVAAMERRFALNVGQLSQNPWHLRENNESLYIQHLSLLYDMGETLRSRFIDPHAEDRPDSAHGVPLAELVQILTLRGVNFGAILDPLYFASRRGAPLLRSLCEVVMARNAPHGRDLPAVSIYVGDDANMASIRALLGFTWVTPEGLKNDVVPGGMLMFERVRHVPSGTRWLRISYHAPTMDQLRTLQHLDDIAPPFFAAFEPPPESATPGRNLIPMHRLEDHIRQVQQEARRPAGDTSATSFTSGILPVGPTQSPTPSQSPGLVSLVAVNPTKERHAGKRYLAPERDWRSSALEDSARNWVNPFCCGSQ